MTTRASIALLTCLLWACDCGENRPGPGLPDVEVDVPDDAAGDGLLDVPGEAAPDADDVLDEDSGTSVGGNPFQCETSGGGALSSENYTMDLFIGPVRPLGNVSSDGYQIKLGPAGTRRP